MADRRDELTVTAVILGIAARPAELVPEPRTAQVYVPPTRWSTAAWRAADGPQEAAFPA